MKCDRCNLGIIGKRVVQNTGSKKATILIILDNPSDVDETFGKLMSGLDGKVLDQMLTEAYNILNISPLSYYITSIVRCRPTNEKCGFTREILAHEVLACTQRFMKSIKQLKPKFVFLVGKITAQFYGKEFPDAKILQPFRFIEKQGGKLSPWYQTNLRIILDTLTEGNKNGY